MLRSYGSLTRSARLSRWHIRYLATAQLKSPELKPRKKRVKSESERDDRPVKKVGRPRKGIDAATVKSADKLVRVPPRLLVPASTKHHDLDSFLAFGASTKLDQTTNVYKGTHYEYLVCSTLSKFNFTLHRTGRANDRGIDMIGHWTLPGNTAQKPQILKVLVQCKASTTRPAMIRELEGAYVGAPAGWNAEGVLALLVSSKPATQGVRSALQRSRWPMGLMQITAEEGAVKQVLWNAEAARLGLEGLGVTALYHEDGRKDEGTIGLTWNGRLWKGKK